MSKTKTKLSTVSIEYSFRLLALVMFLSFLLLLPNVSNAASEIPKVRLSVKALDLSRPPTTEELMAAGQLGGQLYPTADIVIEDKAPIGAKKILKAQTAIESETSQRNKASNLSFGEAIQAWNKHEYKKSIDLFKKHVEEFPDSPWASEAVLHLGCEARYNGRYREAENNFSWLIEKNQGSTHFGARMLANKARLRLGVLKVLQNNIEEAKKHFIKLKEEGSDWRQRTYASHWIQRLSRYKANQLAMLNCGTLALAQVMNKEGRESEAREVMDILPTSHKGQSIEDLKSIAARYGYPLTGLRLSVSELKRVPLPAVLQLSGRSEGDRGHYWILEESGGDSLMLFDPQSNRRFQQSYEEFSREWGGIALVFSDKETVPGIKLSENELGQIYGGCCGVPAPPSKQGKPEKENEGPKSNEEEEGRSCGSPRWSVNMINMNLYVKDTPLWYTPPIGPPVAISLSYNSQSAIAYNEPFGNKWQFNYSSYLVVDPGGIVTIFMPDGRSDVYTPDGAGGYDNPYQVFTKLTKIAENHYELRFPDDTTYLYNIPSGTNSLQPFLVEIRDAYGQGLSFGYDASIHLTTVTDATGKVFTLIYNADGLVTQVVDPFGRSAHFEYDTNRNLTKITDMGGYWSTLDYDQDVYLTSIGDERGTWKFYIEPADGIETPENIDNYSAPGTFMWENYRITVTNPLGGEEEYFYYGGCDSYSCDGYTWYVSPRDYITWQSEKVNNFKIDTPKTRYFFTQASGQQGEISSILYPEGGYIEYGYDSSGNRTSITDSHGHTTQYTYNTMGQLTSLIDPKGNPTTFKYAANGIDLVEIKDGLGMVTMAHNNAHDIKSIIDRLGNTTTYNYNSFGQITSMIDSLGIVNTYLYDTDDRMQQVTKDGNVQTSYSYDSRGRIRTFTDATGLTFTYDYNNLNNITQITYPDNKFVKFTYSDCCPHLLDTVIDRSGRNTHYVYDVLKRLTRVTNPKGGIVRYVYDENGNLAKFLDPNGNSTTFELDLDNRLIKRTYADGKHESFIYDSEGLLIRRTNVRGINADYSYDENHNLLTIDYSDDTPGVTYQYDNYDRVTQRQDGIGTYNYSYDANSRLTDVDGPWLNDTVTYQYDPLGRTKSLSVQGGQTAEYTYDLLSRLTGIQVGAEIFSYNYSNASPLIQSLTRPNGSVTSYRHDTLNRLTEVSNKNSSSEIINQYAYTYNPQDLRTSETITNGNPITSFQNELVTYHYNNLNQLLSSKSPDRTFTYDADGNMTRGYTPEGYVFTASYDAENRLASFEYTDGGGVVHTTEYQYSGDNFLTRKIKYESGATVNDTRFVRNGFLALQERDGSNNIVREYLWGLHVGGGIGGLLTLKQGGQYYSYLYDGKGNITTLLDTAQNVEISYVYDTFGALISQTGPVDQPFRFSTKLYDEETGLSYFGYRFYSSLLGRWMTRDPLGEWGRFYDENEIVNLYDYVLGDPINKLDAFGLQVTFGDNEGVVCYPCGSCYHLWDKAPEEELLREIKKLGDEWFEELGKIEKCKGRWCKDGKLIRDESGKSIPKYETPNPYESPFYDWWMALFEVIVKKLKGDND